MQNRKIIIIIAILAIFIGTGAWSLLNINTNHNRTDNNNQSETADNVSDINAPIYATEFAKQLYTLKNPYIGNTSADGKILSKLFDYYQIENSYTVELQTTEAPFWITVQYKDKPQTEQMLKIAVLFIALTDNCDEFRWSYPNEDGIPKTIFITQEYISETLKITNLKSYSQSSERIQALINLLEQKPLLQDGEQSLFVNWNAYATINFNMEDAERKNWEIRFINDGILYRGETPIYDCRYEDFDKNGQKDLCLLVEGSGIEAWDSIIYIYMNDNTVYSYPVSVLWWRFDNIASGDFDADGNTELAIIGDTGGNGGRGSHAKVLLKYIDNSFREMTIPGDYTDEECQWGEAGYHTEKNVPTEHIGEALTDVVIADTSVEFGKYKGYSIKLVMTDGWYYTEEETLPSIGVYDENYDGNYVLQVMDTNGQIVDEMSLNHDWGYDSHSPASTINFPGELKLCISDYNKDELPDFTIGTAGSSSVNIFELYTINDAGKLENISTGFANISKAFSIFLEQDSDTGFFTRTWNNAIGKEELEYFEWNPELKRYISKEENESGNFSTDNVGVSFANE